MNLVQQLAREEFTVNPPPPRDVVSGALRAGRRLRRWRRAIVGGGLVLVGAFIAITTITRYADPLGVTAADVVIVPVPTSGAKVQATPAGVLEALSYLVPGTYVSPEATYNTIERGNTDDVDMIIVSAKVTTARGSGQITVNITRNPGVYAQTTTSGKCHRYYAESCSYLNLDDGTKVVILHMDGNCDETTTVTATRPSDVEVTVFVPTCIDSRTPAPQMLTAAEAVAIAANPALDMQMAASLVEAGAQHFPDLPETPS